MNHMKGITKPSLRSKTTLIFIGNQRDL